MKLFETTRFLCLIFLFLISPELLSAQETSIMIRVKAKDAKFIGSSMGGSKVIVKEHLSGKILAEGYTSGSTGNTDRIMNNPISRNTQLSDEQTAGFMAKLLIEKPVFVTVSAYAPIDNSVKSETQLWLIPGKDITGDGLILEIPGFKIDVLTPQLHESIGEKSEIEIRANIIMMCGCPLTSGGLWNADEYEVEALIFKDGKPLNPIPMQITDKQSTFLGKGDFSPGNYEVNVYSYDPKTGNTGLGKTSFIVK
ncbi:hypothetical protein ACKGJN_08005 [Gillisia sp. Q332]|uniref:hypothetical protein n=1 Tax=Gillisia xinjiangensis TaxID=3384765 RepID=UPI00391C149E